LHLRPVQIEPGHVVEDVDVFNLLGLRHAQPPPTRKGKFSSQLRLMFRLRLLAESATPDDFGWVDGSLARSVVRYCNVREQDTVELGKTKQ
jgi:hypothetical protein